MMYENSTQVIDVQTFKTKDLPKKYRLQIKDITTQVVEEKKDKYWRNYKFFSLEDQIAVSVSCENDKVQVIASIYHRSFFGKDVYRLCNRFLYSPDFRETGGTKTRGGKHINHPLINQQIQFVEKLNPRFYFISRQRTNTRWLKYYFNKYNEDFNGNLIVSDNQYWVCDGDKEGCVQTIIYPKNMEVPLKLYK